MPTMPKINHDAILECFFFVSYSTDTLAFFWLSFVVKIKLDRFNPSIHPNTKIVSLPLVHFTLWL